MAGFARTILAANDEAVSYFTGSAMSGRLRFGAADELALSELPTILRQFRELYPRINLELTVTQSGILYRRLAANHLDLIFINQEADFGRGRLVRRDRLVWVGIERSELDPRAARPGDHLPRAQPQPVRRDRLPGGRPAGPGGSPATPGRSTACSPRPGPGIGICVLAQSRVPGDLRILSRALRPARAARTWRWRSWTNPRAARGPVEALSQAIFNLPLKPIRRA